MATTATMRNIWNASNDEDDIAAMLAIKQSASRGSLVELLNSCSRSVTACCCIDALIVLPRAAHNLVTAT